MMKLAFVYSDRRESQEQGGGGKEEGRDRERMLEEVFDSRRLCKIMLVTFMLPPFSSLPMNGGSCLSFQI
jgi:hypothetical protein